MYHPSHKKNHQAPANIDSFDVGISYKSEFNDDFISLHNNFTQDSEVKLPLDDQGKCLYQIYFKNKTSRLCEVKIFISNSPTEYGLIGEPSNHLVLKPNVLYYIERPDNINRKYTFVAEESKIYKEIVGPTKDNFNSYITVVVYPEKRGSHQLSSPSVFQESKGLKVETDFGGYKPTKDSFYSASAGPANSFKTDCFGSSKGLKVETDFGGYKPTKDSFYSASAGPANSLKTECFGSSKVTMGGVSVLGEKSNQVFYKAPLLVKEGSSFTYNFKLTGLAKLKYIPFNLAMS